MLANRFWHADVSRLARVLALVLCFSIPPLRLDGQTGDAQLRLDPEAVASLVDSLFAEWMEKDQVPGAAFVLVKDGELVYAQGYGVANLQTGEPVSAERTVFRIGSVSKALTAMAVVQLADRGLIDLDADVSDYLETPLVDDRFSEPVSFSHLLSHTAGFDQIGLRRQASSPDERESLRAFLERELVRVRPPGVVGTYDTYGITLAGHLIEVVSGLPYAEYMRRHVFQPLGMRRSFVEVPDSMRAQLAVGYGLENGRHTPQPYEYYVTLPASSVDATPMDMGRFMIAVLEDGGASLTSRIKQPQFESVPGFPMFSYGFWERAVNGHRAVSHGGVMFGFQAEMFLVPEHRLGFFIVYNRDNETGPPPRLRDEVSEALLDRWFPRDEEPVAGPELQVATDGLTGAYANTLGCFTCEGGEGWPVNAFAVRGVEPGVITLWNRRWIAVDSLVFQLEDGRSRVAFFEDSERRVTYMIYGNYSYARLGEPLFSMVKGSGAREPSQLAALMHATMEEWAEAADVYEAIAERQPENGRARYYAGYNALRAGQADRAIADFAQAIELGRWVPLSMYYIAAAHASKGEEDAAIDSLRRAAELGFRDDRMMKEDPWWSELRDDPRLVQAINAPRERLERERRELAQRPPTFDPAGTYDLLGVMASGDEFTVILEIAAAGESFEGSMTISLRSGQLPLSDITIGGDELWATVGPVELRLRVTATRVVGLMESEWLRSELEGTKH
jgi:CubicO group peptidase (beta-lactamase class C family)